MFNNDGNIAKIKKNRKIFLNFLKLLKTMDTVSAYRGTMTGRKVIVYGLGPSTDYVAVRSDDNIVKIGVNDIGARMNVDYLVCVDYPKAFTSERLKYIVGNPVPMFTHIKEWDGLRVNNIMFGLGMVGGRDIERMMALGKLNYSRTSPFVACVLATYMGFEHIGLAGVDLTQHHLKSRLSEIDEHFRQLNEYHKIYNLSQESAISSLEKISVEEFNQL